MTAGEMSFRPVPQCDETLDIGGQPPTACQTDRRLMGAEAVGSEDHLLGQSCSCSAGGPAGWPGDRFACEVQLKEIGEFLRHLFWVSDGAMSQPVSG